MASRSDQARLSRSIATQVTGVERAPVQSWRVRGFSVAGGSHLGSGRECQDAYRWHYCEAASVLVLAVADGAGSRSRAAEGAAIAVGIAIQSVESLLSKGRPTSVNAWRRLLARALSTTITTCERSARAIHRTGNSGDFAATLTLVVLAPPLMATLSVGDGFVIARVSPPSLKTEEQRVYLTVPPPPPPGEYANETTFLSSSTARDLARVDLIWDPELTGVVLSTDGCAGAGLDFERGTALRPHKEFFQGLFAYVQHEDADYGKLLRYLTSAELAAVSGDDKTLLIAVAP